MKLDYIHIEKDKQHIARERAKAKELRKTHWWKDQITKGLCHYCQAKFEANELTMDHIVPLSRGGKSTKGNIVACCKECNNKKKYMIPAELLFKQIKEENESTE